LTEYQFFYDISIFATQTSQDYHQGSSKKIAVPDIKEIIPGLKSRSEQRIKAIPSSLKIGRFLKIKGDLFFTLKEKWKTMLTIYFFTHQFICNTEKYSIYGTF